MFNLTAALICIIFNGLTATTAGLIGMVELLSLNTPAAAAAAAAADFAGTPNYMAPELFNGTRVDEAADVYSLGCILYECLARKQPFSSLAGDGGKSFNMLFKVRIRV
jgi:serine/threonine protein kinase